MPEFRDEQGDLIATDHFTDADGTHFVDGHAAPCCGPHRLEPGERGKWVPLDATVIPADGKKRVVIVADEEGICRLLSAGQRVIQSRLAEIVKANDGSLRGVDVQEASAYLTTPRGLAAWLDALSEGGSE